MALHIMSSNINARPPDKVARRSYMRKQ